MPRATDIPPNPAVASAQTVGLEYVSDTEPGLHRRKSGQSFRYLDAAGRPVTDDVILRRVRALAIPPAGFSHSRSVPMAV